MRVGTLGDEKEGVWVSYDGRAGGAHPRYWNQAGIKIISSKNEMDNIKWAKGLELSRFSSMKKTEAHQPQKEKLKKLLIRIYHQEGVQYEGDLEAIKVIEAEQHQKQGSKRKKANLDSGKIKNTTPRKSQNTKQDSKSILEQFQIDACNLAATPQFAKKLRAIMKKHVPNMTPPADVLHAALQEAHADCSDDATKARPFMTWSLNRTEHSKLFAYVDDEGANGSNEEDEDFEDDKDTEDVEDDEEEDEH